MLALNTIKTILIIVSGISWGIPFFLTFYILADIPAPQVLSIWRKSLHSTKKPFIDASKIFGADEKALEQKEIEREKYMTFCSRLNKKVSFEELQDKGKKIMKQIIIIGAILSIVAVIFAGVSFFTAFIIMFVSLGLGVYMGRAPFRKLDKEIKILDRDIVFELPIFINSVRVMKTDYTFEKVIESYMKQAGPLRQDLKLTLASLKNKTNVKALIDMANRMQRGQRLEEVSSMIDLMKSLYSGTDVERCCMNLELLANQINELHVKPFILKQKSGKLMKMRLCVFGVVILVFMLYVSPMVIEMVATMNEVNN